LKKYTKVRGKATALYKMINKAEIFKSCVHNTVIIGENVKIILPSNLYGCTIGDDCFVGPFTEIQKGVIIGKGTKIQSHSFICEGVTIGHDCFIGHGVMFVNDSFSDGHPANGDKTKWKPTHIGDHVYIGTNATLLPVNICDHVVIGAGAVVTKDINEPGKYAGNPATRIQKNKTIH
jgi:acetyltransferase-like isoleucine patch superfamily enzyme